MSVITKTVAEWHYSQTTPYLY